MPFVKVMRIKCEQNMNRKNIDQKPLGVYNIT